MSISFEKISNISRIVAYLTVIIVGIVVAIKVEPALNRAVTVLERMDQRVDKMFKGATPVGREAVGRSVDALRSVDTKQMGKDIGDAVRRKLGGK